MQSSPESTRSPVHPHRGLSRAQFLGRTGAALASVGGLGSLLAACGGGSDGSGEGEKLTRALGMHNNAAIGPQLEPFIDKFNKDYAPLSARASLVTGDYIPLTEQQLAGGDVEYDVLYSDEGTLESWYQNGWIRPIEGQDGVDELLANFTPAFEQMTRASDGKLVALPCFQYIETFVVNQAHLEEIGAKAPESWDEFVEQCRELKAKGVTQTPYSPFWNKYAFLIWHMFAAETASDGAEPLFGDDFAPNFATDPVCISTLERWRLLYEEGLVAKDVLTSDSGAMINAFAGGKSSFTMHNQYHLHVEWANPDFAKVADQVSNALIPGSTHVTHTLQGFWYMVASTPEPDKAWQLLDFFGGAGKAGDYHVPKEFMALGLGGSSGYVSVDSSDEVQKAWSEWSDEALLLEQVEKSRALGPVINAAWYPGFLSRISTALQTVITGDKSPQEGLKEVADYVDAERA